jgi:hypothetical protein
MPSTTLSQSYNLPLLTATITGISGGGNTFAALAGIIPVNSTNGFPTSGLLQTIQFDNYYRASIGSPFIISYTNITSTSFTGCTLVSGSASNYIVNNSDIINIGGSASIQVTSTTGFPTYGQLQINGNQYVSYTGISGNTFTGVTGGSGGISSGQTVISWADGYFQITPISSPTETPLHNDPNSLQTNTFGAVLTGLTAAEQFGELNLPQANSIGQMDLSSPALLADPLFYSNPNYDTIAPVNYKMRGYYMVGQVYETWISQNFPSYTPPSGHTLINVIIEEIF